MCRWMVCTLLYLKILYEFVLSVVHLITLGIKIFKFSGC